MNVEIELQEIKAKNLPRLKLEDIFAVDNQLSKEDEQTLREYFSHFTSCKGKCPGCDKRLSSDPISHAFGLATFEWGIANGEGHCSHCGYPARAYHRDVGPIEFLNIVLPYHPDDLEERTHSEDQ